MIATRTLKRTGKRVYDVRLRDPNGKQYNRTFSTRKAAEAFEGDQLAARRHGSWIDPRHATPTVAQLGAEWLTSNPAKRTGTKARDEAILRRHIVPVLGARSIGTVTKPHVQALVNTWSQRAAPRTVKRQYGVLTAMFAYATEADYLARTPCRGVRLPKAPPLRRQLPDADQLAALAAELGPYGLMVWVAVLTGLRWGEVAGLRVGSLDLLRHELRVVEQRTRDLHGDAITASPKSAAGVRTLSIPAGLSDTFGAHLAERGVTAADPDALVFVGARGGRPLNYPNFRQRVWQPACDRAGLTGLGFHDLRRVNATAMVAAGVDLKTAQTRFGHSDPRLTLAVYAQAVTEADRLAADGLGGQFLPMRDGCAMVPAGSRAR